MAKRRGKRKSVIDKAWVRYRMYGSNMWINVNENLTNMKIIEIRKQPKSSWDKHICKATKSSYYYIISYDEFKVKNNALYKRDTYTTRCKYASALKVMSNWKKHPPTKIKFRKTLSNREMKNYLRNYFLKMPSDLHNYIIMHEKEINPNYIKAFKHYRFR